MRLSKSKAMTMLLTLALLLLPASALAESTVTDVGHQKANLPVSFDMMFPSVTYIHVGDTITFTNKATMTPHTVTFSGGDKIPSVADPKANIASQPSGGTWAGKGLLNSGILPPGASYSVTFTAVGVYDYICILHPMMKGQIAVLPAGAPIPSAADQSAAAQAQQMDADAQAAALIAYYQSQLPSGTVNQDGTVTWTVTAGAGFGGFDIEQFYPSSLVISEGDSVTFVNKNEYEPHFVTFPTSPADEAKFLGPNGPNFAAMMTPMGGNVVDGTKLLNSGGIMPNQSVTYTFPKAGTYAYDCYLHDGSKMDGTITVQPKGSYHAYLNGKAFVYTDSRPPHEHNGIVYIPVAAFFRQLGATVAWEGSSRTVTVSTGKEPAQPTAVSGEGIKVVIDGKLLSYGWDPKPHIHEDHVYVPAQALVEALGGRFTYDAATRTISMWVK